MDIEKKYAIDTEIVDHDVDKRIAVITQEFKQGFAFIRKYQKSVSIFGSHNVTAENPHYQRAQSLGTRIAKLGYAVITGGGSGIMEAANRGAFIAGGKSIGLDINSLHESKNREYFTDYMGFHYFFTRKVMLSFAAEAYIFFPGGYGMLDEFFEIMTLIQSKRITAFTPIILYGQDFWQPMDKYIREVLLKTYNTIDSADVNLYRIEDDEETIMKIIAEAPVVETIPFAKDKQKL